MRKIYPQFLSIFNPQSVPAFSTRPMTSKYLETLIANEDNNNIITIIIITLSILLLFNN